MRKMYEKATAEVVKFETESILDLISGVGGELGGEDKGDSSIWSLDNELDNYKL